jgi:hypothetical protein
MFIQIFLGVIFALLVWDFLQLVFREVPMILHYRRRIRELQKQPDPTAQ